MKKFLALISIIVILFTGCSTDIDQNQIYTKEDAAFSAIENNGLTNNSGTKYTLLAPEGKLYYLGELDFIGGVQCESKTLNHLYSSFQTGLFKIKNAENDNILIRVSPDSEWFAIYRKSSLPEFDFSLENCIRLELVSGIGDTKNDSIHKSCNDGITDKTEIKSFLTDIKSQKSPKDAGLNDFVLQPDGSFENCYVYAVIYGYFEEEPDLVIRMQVWSYNDLAYSVSIEDKEYVLPDEWFEKLTTDA